MDYYHKYLKYKLKYLLLAKQIGGAGLPTNYFETFFKISNEDTNNLNDKFKVILDKYWLIIGDCYKVIDFHFWKDNERNTLNKSNFVFDIIKDTPAKPSLITFLSDHNPIYGTTQNIISWNIGFTKNTSYPLIKHLESIEEFALKKDFKKDIDKLIDKLLLLHAQLIVEYILYYKKPNTMVNLQECGGKLYNGICKELTNRNINFASDFIPQTLMKVSENIKTKNNDITSYYITESQHIDTGFCTFFFPQEENKICIRLIPCNIQIIYGSIKNNECDMVCRGCKIAGLENITENNIYNLHLRSETSYEFQCKLLRCNDDIFECKLLISDPSGLFDLSINKFTGSTSTKEKVHNIYDNFKQEISKNHRLGLDIKDLFIIKDDKIYGNSTVSTKKGIQNILSGDFNVDYKQFDNSVKDNAFIWPHQYAQIDYIIFNTIE
jgi:hypothetical protein